MFSYFRRLSIVTQAAFLLLLMLISAVSVLYFWAIDNAMESELAHTRTVADMADAFRMQAARHGGFYVRRNAQDDVQKVGRYLASYEAETPPVEGVSKRYVFHQKNPFLALADYSAEVQASPAAAKFRIVSDNYMNPANAPDNFERNALQHVRAQGEKEYWDIVNGKLRYARALPASKDCLTCHGSPEDAPYVVRTQYTPPLDGQKGGGYGYAEGELVGLTSVTVPHKTPLEMLAEQKPGFWISAGFLLFIMLFSFGVIIQGVVRPLRRQCRYANDIALSDDIKSVQIPPAALDEHQSSNEIHQQAHALKTLHESMAAAMALITGKR